MEPIRCILGEIELDPASNAEANKIVQAQRYFTKQDDGIRQNWYCRRLYLNPPYSNPRPFVEKLVYCVQRGIVSTAILVVNNATDTGWFREAMTAARYVHFPRRIKFVHPVKGTAGSNRYAQAIIGFNVPDTFITELEAAPFGGFTVQKAA